MDAAWSAPWFDPYRPLLETVGDDALAGRWKSCIVSTGMHCSSPAARASRVARASWPSGTHWSTSSGRRTSRSARTPGSSPCRRAGATRIRRLPPAQLARKLPTTARPLPGRTSMPPPPHRSAIGWTARRSRRCRCWEFPGGGRRMNPGRSMTTRQCSGRGVAAAVGRAARRRVSESGGARAAHRCGGSAEVVLEEVRWTS